MKNTTQQRLPSTTLRLAVAVAAAIVIWALTISAAAAQTLTVLHTFSGEADGAQPGVGLTMDAAGNLYGTTSSGGPGRFGTVFKVTHRSSGWEFTTLYSFRGGADGGTPETRVIFGPDGTFYGATNTGGDQGCGGYNTGCGVVFNLRPPTSACKTAVCYWTENVIYTFTGDQNTGFPFGDIAFDSHGNLYGGAGLVYELSPSNGQWTLTAVGNEDLGATGVALDAAGAIYSTSYPNLVYRLVPSGTGWLEQDLFDLNDQMNGYGTGGLTLDHSGNVYGGTSNGGPAGSGTVFELAPENGGWNFSLLYAFSGMYDFGGPTYNGSMTLDSAGNVYGTAAYDGAYNVGSAFRLSPSNGSWSYSDLHDFHVNGSDGCYPNNSMVIDSSGNLYGTTGSCGGNPGYGVVFEITP